MRKKIIRTIIADTDPVFVKSICDYAKGERDIDIVGLSNNGKDLIKGLGNTSADILVLESLLPGIDGLGVARAMKKLTIKKPRLIMLSSFSKPIYVQTAMSLGVDYYMLKPVDVAYLLNQIRFVANGPVLLKENGKEQAQALHALLLNLGIPSHLYGFKYIKDAVLMTLANKSLTGQLSKTIYPAIGEKYKKSSMSIEKAIRHAISKAYERSNNYLFEDLFPYSKRAYKPWASNGEFISTIAEKITFDFYE